MAGRQKSLAQSSKKSLERHVMERVGFNKLVIGCSFISCLSVILRPFPLFVDVMIFSVSITLCFIGVSIVWVEPFVTSNDPAPVTRIFNCI